MASVTSLTSSSSASSIYGNKNIISGLASGMDTEAMIENSISGYKTKISKLQQRMTKMQWKQDAYRNIIGQMNNVLSKYTSYTSSTNLFSSSFFTKAVTTVANGANAAKVSATGKSTSDVQLDRVRQLAQAASYSVGTDNLAAVGSATDALNLDGEVETSSIAGSLTLKYGGGATGSGTSITLRFDEGEVYKDANELADAINSKLKEKNIKSSGGTSSADNFIKAEVQDGKVVLNDQKGNYFAVTGVSGDGLSKIFSKAEASNRTISSNAINDNSLSKKISNSEYLKDKSLTFTLDGKSKSIKLDFAADEDMTSEKFVETLQGKLDDAFGKGKIGVGLNAQGGLEFGKKVTTGTDGESGKTTYKFEKFDQGSVFTVNGSSKVNEALGMKEAGYSNTLQTGWKLSDVLGDSVKFEATKNDEGQFLDKDGKVVDDESKAAKVATLTINGVDIKLNEDDTIKSMMDKINGSDAGVNIKYSNLTGRFAITANETGADSKVDISGDLGTALFQVPKEGTIQKANFAEAYGVNMGQEGSETFKVKFQFDKYHYSFNLTVSENETIEDVINRLNDRPLVRDEHFSFNEKTGQIEYTDQFGETSSGVTITDKYGFDYKPEGDYAPKGTYTKGQDAKFSVTVNGQNMELTRSSNTVDLDGLSVTLKGTFGYDEDGKPIADTEPVTFTTKSDSDKIVDAVKSFIEDYNKLATAIHDAYSTEPLTDSKRNYYDPLTEDQESSMTETAIKNYEEKAKTGLLYGDSDLANLYSRLTDAVQGNGEVGSMLRSIGITTNYSNRLTTLELDEDALRNALENNPDRVKDAFTQTTANGASQNGMMANLKSTLEMYGSTSIASPGILVDKAGTPLSSYSLNNNELNDQMESLQEQIEKWQDKMSDRIDYYTNQFTQLELLIQKMNSQSSTLSGLIGGY